MGLSFTDLNKTLNIYMMIGKPLELIEINFCSCLNNELYNYLYNEYDLVFTDICISGGKGLEISRKMGLQL